MVNIELKTYSAGERGLSVSRNSSVKTKQHPPSKIAPFSLGGGERSLQLYYSVTLKGGERKYAIEVSPQTQNYRNENLPSKRWLGSYMEKKNSVPLGRVFLHHVYLQPRIHSLCRV